MIRRFLFALSFALALPALVQAAGEPPSPLEVQLHAPATARALRAGLLALARRNETSDPATAGAALYAASSSYARDGLADSSIAALGRAVVLRGGLAERHALVEALFARRQAGDFAEALRQAKAGQQAAVQARLPGVEYFRAAAGWAEFLLGNVQAAKTQMAPVESRVAGDEPWRRRYARLYLGLEQSKAAYNLLMPLGVRSRGMDDEVISLLERAITGQMMRFPPKRVIDSELQIRDDLEARTVDRFGGARVRFGGKDGFPLGGVLTDAPASRAPAVITIAAPGDTMAAYDSLAIALRTAGFATLILELRGSGWSVGPRCPLPGSWAGRESAMETACGGDARAALRALARETKIDTSSYQVLGVGTAAGAAIRAAELDRHVVGLVLVRPEFDDAAIAPAGAALARSQVPVYFIGGGEDDPNRPTLEALYGASNRGASRMADTGGTADGMWDLARGRQRNRAADALAGREEPARAASATPPKQPR